MFHGQQCLFHVLLVIIVACIVLGESQQPCEANESQVQVQEAEAEANMFLLQTHLRISNILLQRPNSNTSSSLAKPPFLQVDKIQKEVLHNLWKWSLVIGSAIIVCLIQTRRSERSGSDHRTAIGTDALTGIRSPVMCLIVLYHMGLYPFADVGLFFVLSGCVLSLSRRSQPGSVKSPFESWMDILRFVAPRFGRILPLYWVAVACGEPFYQYGKGSPALFACSLLCNLFALPFKRLDVFFAISLMAGSEYFWFVRSILVLYLVYPFLERLVCSDKDTTCFRLLVLVLLCCAMKFSMLILIACQHDQARYLLLDGWYDIDLPILNGVHISMYANPLLRLPEFLLGVALPHLPPQWTRSNQKQSTDKGALIVESESAMRGHIFACWRPAFIDVLCLSYVASIFLLKYNATTVNLMNNNAFFLLQALLLWSICWQPFSSFVSRILSFPPLVWHGGLTYGIYLFQLMDGGNYAWGEWGKNWPEPDGSMVGHWSDLRLSFLGAAMLELAFATVIAWALQKLVEEPISDLIRWSLRKTK